MKTLGEQNENVITYFNTIKKQDPLLDIESFFQRVCRASKNNGFTQACAVYDLNEDIINQITTQESK